MSFENKLRVELRNSNGVLLSYLNNKMASASWAWNRIGGCGECNLRLVETFDSVLAGSFSEDAEIRIYIPNAAGTSQLWYSGYIDKVTPGVGKTEYIDLYIMGYVNQLKRVIVKDATYTSQELSVIARNVAEVYATAFTAVVSSSSNYEDSQFTADTIYFNESAFDVITKLADIGGKIEWGVDENKNLFFKNRNQSIGLFFNIKQDFVSYKPIKDFNEIITAIYLEGGDGYTQKFSVTNKLNVRETILQNSSISTQSVGYQYARSVLKELGGQRRLFEGQQIGRTTRIESTVPIPYALIYDRIGVRLKYDVAAQLYDSGLKYDGGNLTLRVEKIKYELKDSMLNAVINFGGIPSTISDELAKLEYQINQTANI